MIKPGATIGIIGGGQFAMMLAMAAHNLSYRVHLFCDDEKAPAVKVADQVTIASYNNEEKVTLFARYVDVVAIERGDIPYHTVHLAEQFTPVYPSSHIFYHTHNRLREKQLLQQFDFPVASYAAILHQSAFFTIAADYNYQCVLKKVEQSYDGKEIYRITHYREVVNLARTLLSPEHEGENPHYLLEAFIPHSYEITAMVVRTESGDIVPYPVTDTVYENGILRSATVPTRLPAILQARAIEMASKIADSLKVKGLLAVEYFVTAKEELIINEVVARPHTAFYWTLDAAITCQFEQLIRALCNLPLGSPNMMMPAKMTNLIGQESQDWHTWLENPCAKLYLYGKDKAHSRRKMGHVTELSLAI